MSSKVRVGVIGTGMIANLAHIPGYLNIPDECEIVGVCDPRGEAIDSTKARHEVGKVYADYKEMLADPTIDAVSVCTPNLAHSQITVDALNAGKNVLCEKPLSMNAEQSKAMCRAARDSGKILQVAFQMRFSKGARFLREFIDNGHMGDIYYARAQALRRRGVPHWGVFIDKEKQGGGPLIDIGVHILDITLFLMGNPKPVSASGKTWDVLAKNTENKNFWGEFDRSKFTVEDFAAGFIRFDNGAVVSLESSFMANIEGDPFQTQVMGTKGGGRVHNFGNDCEIYKQMDGQYFNMIPQNLPDVESQYHDEVKAFVNAVKTGAPSPVPGECGLTLNAIFDALYKSSVTGKEEAVDVSY